MEPTRDELKAVKEGLEESLRKLFPEIEVFIKYPKWKKLI